MRDLSNKGDERGIKGFLLRIKIKRMLVARGLNAEQA